MTKRMICGVVLAVAAAILLIAPHPVAASDPVEEVVLTSHLPKDPLFAWDARVGNAGKLFDSMVAMVRRFTPPEEQAKVDENLAKMDKELGMSLRSDLLAYLGPEFAFVFDLPPIDQAMGSAMSGDPDATASTLQGIGIWCSITESKKVDNALRALLEKSKAQLTDLDGVVKVTFKNEDAAKADAQPAGPTPPKPAFFYTLSDHLLAIAFSADRARSMLDPQPVGQGLADGADFTMVRQYLDPHPQSLMYVNVPKLQGMIKESNMLKGILQAKEESQPFVDFVLDPDLAPMGLGVTTVPAGKGTRQTSAGPSWMAGGKFMGAVMASIAIPNMINAVNRGRQKRTMADMRTVATALEAFAVDNNAYPTTDGWVDCGELAGRLTPTYLKELPTKDGWGFPLRCWSDGQHYRLVSPGKDGQKDQDWSGKIEETQTSSFDNDIVFVDGQFMVYPKGTQK